jgi:hypothetical protein
MSDAQEPDYEEVVRRAIYYGGHQELVLFLRDLSRRLRAAEREIAELRGRSYQLIV